jgi:hypothetical protein
MQLDQRIAALNTALPTFHMLSFGDLIGRLVNRVNVLAIEAELLPLCQSLDADPAPGHLTDYAATAAGWTSPATRVKLNALLAKLDTDPALTLKPYMALAQSLTSNAGIGPTWTQLMQQLCADPGLQGIYTDHDVTVW